MYLIFRLLLFTLVFILWFFTLLWSKNFFKLLLTLLLLSIHLFFIGKWNTKIGSCYLLSFFTFILYFVTIKKFFLNCCWHYFYYLYIYFLLVNEIQKLVPVIYFRFLLLFFTLLRSKNFFKLLLTSFLLSIHLFFFS